MVTVRIRKGPPCVPCKQKQRMQRGTKLTLRPKCSRRGHGCGVAIVGAGILVWVWVRVQATRWTPVWDIGIGISVGRGMGAMDARLNMGTCDGAAAYV